MERDVVGGTEAHSERELLTAFYCGGISAHHLILTVGDCGLWIVEKHDHPLRSVKVLDDDDDDNSLQQI